MIITLNVVLRLQLCWWYAGLGRGRGSVCFEIAVAMGWGVKLEVRPVGSVRNPVQRKV